MALKLERDVLCVIPCRLSSKGVPRKNLCKVAGKSLFQRAVEFALDLTDNVVVTTDEAEIAALAGFLGVPLSIAAFPPLYHGDQSKAADVWRHAWKAAEGARGREFEVSIYLEPTSPCRERWMATEALSMLDMSRDAIDEVWTMEPVPPKYRAMRQYEVEDGALVCSTDAGDGALRQQMSPTMVKNGAIYCAYRSSVLLSAKSSRIAPLVTQHLVNIDTLDDMAEADRVLREREE